MILIFSYDWSSCLLGYHISISNFESQMFPHNYNLFETYFIWWSAMVVLKKKGWLKQIVMAKDLSRRNSLNKCEFIAAILNFMYQGGIGLHLFCQNWLSCTRTHTHMGLLCYSGMLSYAALGFSDILKNLFATSHNDVKSWFSGICSYIATWNSLHFMLQH